MKEIWPQNWSFETYWKYSRVILNNECSFKEFLSDPKTDTEADNNLKTYRNSQLDPEAKSDCVTDNTSINETSDIQEVNADHEEKRSSFKN